MLDFSVEIKFVDFIERLGSAACALKKKKTLTVPRVQSKVKNYLQYKVRSDSNRVVAFVLIKIKFQ